MTAVMDTVFSSSQEIDSILQTQNNNRNLPLLMVEMSGQTWAVEKAIQSALV